MRLMAFASTLVLALGVALGIAIPSNAGVVPIEDPVKARLVAESGAIVPGKTLWVALRLEIAPGWHAYWRNPGDSGLPPEISWKLPPGFSAGGSPGRCRSALSTVRSAITAIRARSTCWCR